MATPQAQEMNETWPLRDGEEYCQDFEDTIPSSGCGFIVGLCWWRQRTSSNGYVVEEVFRESWLKKKAKELKEISEVLAGPRWKNFIRRFSIYGINKKRRQFQYDPQSYQLNFDDNNREVDAEYPDFSARFAAPAGINNGEHKIGFRFNIVE